MAIKGSFQAGLKGFSETVQKKAKNNVRKVVIAALGGVINTSPVDTGMFRLNWSVSAGAPDAAIKTSGDPNQQLSAAQKLPFDVGDTIYIANGLPYANRIESGWSRQAPGGVVAPVVRDIESKIRGGALD